MNEKFKYLIYDIESVVNKKLLNKVLYPGLGYTDEQAYDAQLLELSPDKKGFINPSFHRPICLAAVAVAPDLSITKIGLLGGDTTKARTTGNIVRGFWDIYNNKEPVLVDFNGKGFDLRLLELWAFQLGIKIHPRHFANFGTRYRFAEAKHLDLQEFMSNYGAIRYKGGLNLLSKMLGKPGKMDTKGDMVEELFNAKEFFTIDDYCLSDAMDTYFVFLRTRVVTGEITLDREKSLVDAAVVEMEKMSKADGYFKRYLENFGEWDASEFE